MSVIAVEVSCYQVLKDFLKNNKGGVKEYAALLRLAMRQEKMMWLEKGKDK